MSTLLRSIRLNSKFSVKCGFHGDCVSLSLEVRCWDINKTFIGFAMSVWLITAPA